MSLAREEMVRLFRDWLVAWNDHDLEGVMALLHDEIEFDHWTCGTITGKQLLRRAWGPWFLRHGNFRFTEEDSFVDEEQQKLLFRWRLEWPSPEMAHKGKAEVRRGVDVLHFLGGRIHKKFTYSKTTLEIESTPVALQAAPSPQDIRPSSPA